MADRPMHRRHFIPDPRRWIYRQVFRAAAIYNLVWGLAVLALPATMLSLLGVSGDAVGRVGIVFWQCIGMFVLVFALGYHAAAREPERFAPFILIGLLGKVLGPIGFAIGWAEGVLPLRFGWTLLFNDLIWWPVFVPFVYETIVRRLYEPREP